MQQLCVKIYSCIWVVCLCCRVCAVVQKFDLVGHCGGYWQFCFALMRRFVVLHMLMDLRVLCFTLVCIGIVIIVW